MDDGTLYCSSKDLVQSLWKPTAFCVFTGTEQQKNTDSIVLVQSLYYLLHIHSCRSCFILLSMPACCILVLPSGGSVLEDEVSLTCSLIPKGPSHEIHPHCMHCYCYSCPIHPCSCYYVSVCSWKVFCRSSEWWFWIWNYTVSTTNVHRKAWKHNILLTHPSHYCLGDYWNSSTSCCLLDYSQGTI